MFLYLTKTFYCFYAISFIHLSAYINHIYITSSAKASGSFTSSSISLYPLYISYTKTNSIWIMYSLEIRVPIVRNFLLPSHITLSCFFFFFFIIGLYFLISAVTAQKYNPTAELVMPTGTQINEANAETEIQIVIFEAKISKCST